MAASIMALTSLTACGGSTEDFCNAGEDIESFEPGSDDVKDAMDEAVDNAPDEIRDDVETLRDASEQIDPDDPSSMEDVDMNALNKANKNVSDYVAENCSE